MDGGLVRRLAPREANSKVALPYARPAGGTAEVPNVQPWVVRALAGKGPGRVFRSRTGVQTSTKKWV